MNISIPALYEIYLNHPTICTDNRKVKEGDLFFALKGERFDGNQFAQQAVDAGAAYAIVDDPNVVQSDAFILVDDVLTTLQLLATHHRLQFDIPVIGVTGTNGKTTTKELLTTVLGQRYNVHATKGNFNNHIGVPLTLLEMPRDTTLAVIEMGANKLKEIGELCAIAQPNYGIVTNVGKAHLEGFGSFEGVKETKSELYDWLAAHSGVVFVNNDEQFLPALSAHVAERVDYGLSVGNPFGVAIEMVQDSVLVGAKVKRGAEEWPIVSQLYGSYNFNNIMAALVIGVYFDVSMLQIKEAVESYSPSNNRSQIKEVASNTFIMDAYNANPVSMAKSLESFAVLPASGKTKIAILGDMLELGEVSDHEHQNMVEKIKSLNIDKVILVGKEMSKTDRPADLRSFESCEALNEWLVAAELRDHLFLLKGSRSIGLEGVLKVYE